MHFPYHDSRPHGVCVYISYVHSGSHISLSFHRSYCRKRIAARYDWSMPLGAMQYSVYRVTQNVSHFLFSLNNSNKKNVKFLSLRGGAWIAAPLVIGVITIIASRNKILFHGSKLIVVQQLGNLYIQDSYLIFENEHGKVYIISFH